MSHLGVGKTIPGRGSRVRRQEGDQGLYMWTCMSGTVSTWSENNSRSSKDVGQCVVSLRLASTRLFCNVLIT
jgi:hypothetical protein